MSGSRGRPYKVGPAVLALVEDVGRDLGRNGWVPIEYLDASSTLPRTRLEAALGDLCNLGLVERLDARGRACYRATKPEQLPLF